MQISNSYRTEFYNPVFAFLEEIKGTAAAVSRILCDVLVTQVPDTGSEKMVTVKKFVAAAMLTFHHSRRRSKKSAQSRLQNFCFQLSTATNESSPENTPEPSLFVLSASLPLLFPLVLAALFSVAPHDFAPALQPSL